MADMKDALRGAGFQGARPQGGQRGGSPPGRLAGGGEGRFPPGYPQYFTPEGHLRVELVMKEAEEMAKRFEDDGLRRHQLRAFYDHAKRQLQRLAYGAPFGDVWPEIGRLRSCAADRAGRKGDNALPQSFKEFIDRNVEAVKDERCFRKGFMPHFEAVVGYCARIKKD
jgi:CRISPR/Cas system CSM-associated protein Csm2 small subunit